MCQSLLESRPWIIRLQLDYCSYLGNDWGMVQIVNGYYSSKYYEEIYIPNVIQKDIYSKV